MSPELDRLPDRTGDRIPPSADASAVGVSTPKRKQRGKAQTLSPDTSVIEALLTVEEVAGILRLSAKGVYSLIEMRKIPFIRVSNRVRFFRADVLEWLRENRVPVLEIEP